MSNQADEYASELWPNKQDKCYDCGSNIPNHHTPSCDFTEEGNILDLEEHEGTQHWNGNIIK